MKWVLLLACLGAALCAAAQSYPGSRPITLVVPFAAGGPTDRVARDFVQAMRQSMGKGAQFVIENVNGAGGTIGAARVAKARPDGYTLLLWHIGMASTPSLYRKLPYQSLEDFEYLGMLNDVPMALVGRTQLPSKNYRELEKYLRSNASRLNMAHAGLGSASHICALMWQAAMHSVQAMRSVPFGGTAPAMSALVGGQVDVLCDQTTNTTSQIESGRIKVFAVTSVARLNVPATLQGYPTLQEMGLKDFNLSIWHGLYAPKGTPAPVLKQLNEALKQTLKDPVFIQKQQVLGAIVVSDARQEPAGHKAFVVAEMAKLKPVIEASGKFAD